MIRFLSLLKQSEMEFPKCLDTKFLFKKIFNLNFKNLNKNMVNIWSVLLHLQCLQTPLFLIGYLFLKSCNTKNIAVPLKSLL